ncbi:MAG TPA: AsmA-like C-terminal domain-containing protein [Planctomycetota bacterium]|nr:AsmA-like C-terminal domain-containing protein [Planctomycetota bacterium]
MKTTPGRKLLRIAWKTLAVLFGLLLIITIYMLLGGARFVATRGLSAAMNGYATMDEASYLMFGNFNAENLDMVLDWEGKQETIISVRKLRVRPRILPLLAGRFEFDGARLSGVDLNFRMLPSQHVNIEKLFKVKVPPKDPFIRTLPPRYVDAEDIRLSFPPFVSQPVPIDRVRFSFRSIAYPTVQLFGYGKVVSPVLGAGNAMVYVGLQENDYLVLYEGSYIDLDFHYMQNILPLPPSLPLDRYLMPRGRLRFTAAISGRRGLLEYSRLAVELAGLDVQSLQYPLSITGATGTIVSDGYNVGIEQFSCIIPIGDTKAALHGSGQILKSGEMLFNADISDLHVDNSILAFLPGSEINDFLNINGDFLLSANVHVSPGWAVPRLSAEFSFNGLISPVDLPIPISALSGTVRTETRGSVIIDEIQAFIGEGATRSQILAGGVIEPAKNIYDLYFFTPGITISNDLLGRLPQVPPELLENINVFARVAAKGAFMHSMGDTSIELHATLDSGEVSSVKHPEVSITDIQAAVQVIDVRMTITGFSARSLGGTIKLETEAGLSRNNPSFRGELTASDIDFSRLPRDLAKKEIAGILSGVLFFEGKQLTLPQLKARGSLNLKEGRLVELPVLISIINFLNLRLPGPVVFTSVEADFRIADGLVHIDRAVINSDTLTVYTRGKVGFDGRLDLRAGVGYRRPILRQIPIIGPVLYYVTSSLGSVLTTVNVTGTVDDPTVTLVSAEYLTSPIKAVYRFFEPEKDNPPE